MSDTVAPTGQAGPALIGGMTPTGRRISGPASDLVELAGLDSETHLAVVFHDKYKTHDTLTTGVELVQSFMEFPMVPGIAEMSHAGIGEGEFAFKTGDVVTVFEALRHFRDHRTSGGVRAGLELCYFAAKMLQEASENGPMQGIYSHGGLTPWRIGANREGGVVIWGYGLAQVEIHVFREDESQPPREDSLRYCPPERLLKMTEDVRTDLFSLVLICHEFITGTPVLSGRLADIKTAAEMGHAQQALQKDRTLPKAVRDVFVYATAFDPMGRYEGGDDFANAIGAALQAGKIDGKPLVEVINTVTSSAQRGRAIGSASPGLGPSGPPAGRVLRPREGGGVRVASGPPAAGGAARPSASGRWGKVARSDEEEAAPASRVATRPARGRRGGGDDEETSAVASRPTRRRGAADDDESPRARRSLRRSASSDDDDAPRARRSLRRSASTDDEAAADDEAPRARRSLRRSTSADDDEAAAAAPRRLRRSAAPEEPDAEEPSPSRRRRAAASEEPAEEAPAAEDESPRRRRRGAAAEEKAPEPAAKEEDEASPRRRRRSAAAEEEAPEPAAEKEEEAAPRRRRRGAAAEEEAPEPAADKEEEAAPRRRRRGAAAEEETPEPEKEEASPRRRRRSAAAKEEEEPAEAEAEEEEPNPRRRRRRTSSDD